MGAVAFTWPRPCFSVSLWAGLMGLATAAAATLEDGGGCSPCWYVGPGQAETAQGCCDSGVIDDDSDLSRYSEAELANWLRGAVEQVESSSPVGPSAYRFTQVHIFGGSGGCRYVGQSDASQVHRMLGLGISVVRNSQDTLTPLLNLAVRLGTLSLF